MKQFQPMKSSESMKQGTTLAAVNVGASIKDKKGIVQDVLKEISISAEPGEMLAIMGPSGSGKTTLLNLFANRLGKKFRVSGSVWYNGHDDQLSEVEDFSAYVMQEDHFLEFLTVRETLIYTAKLRLYHLKKAQQMERVEWCITNLGLASCQDVFVGGINIKGCSGGQRKRVSVAIALLANPSILFLDEPTSGLDAALSYDVMKTVANIAHNFGQTVICTIHQPRSQVYGLFDSLLLLRAGKTVYRGPADGAVNWFSEMGYQCPEEFNPPDFFLDLLSSNSGEKGVGVLPESPSLSAAEFLADTAFPSKSFWDGRDERTDSIHRIYVSDNEAGSFAARFNESSLAKEQMRRIESLSREVREIHKADSVKNTGPIAYVQSIFRLAARHLLNVRRQPVKIIAPVIQFGVMGLITSSVWWQMPMPSPDLSVGDCDFERLRNLAGGIQQMFQMIAFSSFEISINTVKERPLINREISSGLYTRSAIYWGTAVAYLAYQYWGALVYFLVVYFGVGLQKDVGIFFESLLIFGLMKFISSSVSFTTGSLGPTIPTATALMPLIMVAMVVVSGFMIQDNDVPIGLIWLKYISHMRYGLQSLVRIQIGGPPNYAHFCFGFTTSQEYWWNVLWIAVCAAVWRLIGFTAWMTMHKKQGIQ